MTDWKKVLGTSILSASLVFSSFAPLVGNVPTATAKTNSVVHTEDGAELPFLHQHVGGPFDLGMVNREKVLASLIKQGVISKNASAAQQEKQLGYYLSQRAKKANQLTADQQGQKAIRTEIQKQFGLKQVPAGTPKTEDSKTKATAKKVESIVEEDWNGEVTTDEVLVLLIDFPDYKNSEITGEDNPVLLYDNYTKEHYEDMVFGDGTFEGGNGEEFLSMKEFYEQQSGGSYTIDGAVSDWYTASQPAAYYGGNYPTADGNDIRPRELTFEALTQAAQDPSINLVDFDKEDLYDLDGDGNYREPDGIIDHLMIVHAGTGEEAGGGAIGGDAIWSHSWSLEQPTKIPGTNLYAYDYTVQPEDGATGVFAHEYGHDLGLPDEYDSAYTAGGVGAPTEYWTLMSAGSWAGLINGTEPTGFSPANKEYLQLKWPNSNWFKNVEYSLEDIMSGEKVLNLDQASVKGTNADAVRISLPDKQTVLNVPTSGEFEYHGGTGSDLDTSLSITVDLTTATSAEFTFNAFYDIEENWDYGSVQVKDASGEWVAIQGNITTDQDPEGYGQNPGHGITGNSNGWVPASFDLSAYAGQTIEVKINYWSDPYVALPGLYVDDIKVVVDGTVVASDDAESEESVFTADGFIKTNGKKTSEHYYLVEWRNWAAADVALGRIARGTGDSVLTLDPGMVIWYVDNLYDNNWVGDHPGEGFIGVVDAHQPVARWTDDNSLATTRYQIQDAAFSLNATDDMFLDYSAAYGEGVGIALESQPAVSQFSDYNDYSTPDLIYSGKNVPKYGLEISVVDQAKDMTVGQIKFAYDNHETNVQVSDLKEVYSSKVGQNVVDFTVVSDDETPGAEVTVTAAVVNAVGETVVSANQSYTSDRNEKELPFSLTLPEGLASGEYSVVATLVIDGVTEATSANTVAVDNDAPVLTLLGDNPTVVEVGSGYVEPGFTAEDNFDGDLSGVVVVSGADALDVDTLGEYTLTYTVTDSVGHVSSVTRTVTVVDTQAPVITLEGENPVTVVEGSEFTDPGFTATDNYDGDLTGAVTVTGTVDTDTVGAYLLTYTVVDASGNTVSVDRVVNVTAAPTTDDGSDDDDSDDDSDTDDDNGTGTDKGSDDGDKLPNTATNSFNILFAGMIVFVLGLSLIVLQRRKKGLQQ